MIAVDTAAAHAIGNQRAGARDRALSIVRTAGVVMSEPGLSRASSRCEIADHTGLSGDSSGRRAKASRQAWSASWRMRSSSKGEWEASGTGHLACGSGRGVVGGVVGRGVEQGAQAAQAA